MKAVVVIALVLAGCVAQVEVLPFVCQPISDSRGRVGVLCTPLDTGDGE